MLQQKMKFLAAACVMAPNLALAAGVGWSEFTQGDLADSHGNPTVITAAYGDNIIAGAVGNASQDFYDVFAFDVNDGLRLRSVNVNYYDETDGNYTSLMLYPSDVACNCLGYEAYAKVYESSQGQDFGSAFAPFFNTAANSLDYYFVLAEKQSNPATYALNFVFEAIPGSALEVQLLEGDNGSEIPVPGAAWLFGSALVVLIAKRRRAAEQGLLP